MFADVADEDDEDCPNPLVLLPLPLLPLLLPELEDDDDVDDLLLLLLWFVPLMVEDVIAGELAVVPDVAWQAAA